MVILRSLRSVVTFSAAKAVGTLLAFALVLVVARDAQAGVILGAQAEVAAMCAAEVPSGSSRPGDHIPAKYEHLDVSPDEALPGGAGTSTTTTTTSSAPALPAVVCDLPSPALSASLSAERALLLPPSPLFDRLRPPRS